eukprot:GHVL01000738.1.p1 GENE.GHVL01000738.1~~GHVL01000738.1.p1  ORF type:complete len:176 (+),score=41.19 GHVL01000738.1:171-698(+)
MGIFLKIVFYFWKKKKNKNYPQFDQKDIKENMDKIKILDELATLLLIEQHNGREREREKYHEDIYETVDETDLETVVDGLSIMKLPILPKKFTKNEFLSALMAMSVRAIPAKEIAEFNLEQMVPMENIQNKETVDRILCLLHIQSFQRHQSELNKKIAKLQQVTARPLTDISHRK